MSSGSDPDMLWVCEFCAYCLETGTVCLYHEGKFDLAEVKSMKKFLALMLMLSVLGSCMFVLTGCGDSVDEVGEEAAAEAEAAMGDFYDMMEGAAEEINEG